jgi:hypothetical protein
MEHPDAYPPTLEVLLDVSPLEVVAVPDDGLELRDLAVCALAAVGVKPTQPVDKRFTMSSKVPIIHLKDPTLAMQGGGLPCHLLAQQVLVDPLYVDLERLSVEDGGAWTRVEDLGSP